MYGLDPRGSPQLERHTPVLQGEVIRFLARPGAVLIDATVGDGGHAAALLAASGPGARLLGIDLDPAALREAAHVLEPFGERVRLVRGTFADIARHARTENFARPTGILFDLGLRSAQLGADRGFSFGGSATLDMRFDPTGRSALPEPSLPALQRLARQRGAYTAQDVLRFLSARELEEVLRGYGDERFARRVAEMVVEARRRAPVRTASDLVSLVVRARPPRARHGRIHAATKVFQALRIAVNREFESLEAGIREALSILAPGGRVAVIAYHSGEDRMVKRLFRVAAGTGAFSLVTRRPLTTSIPERAANPRSRSAKLRVIEHTPPS